MLGFWAGLSWRVSPLRLLAPALPARLSDGYTSWLIQVPRLDVHHHMVPLVRDRSHSAQKRSIRDDPRWLCAQVLSANMDQLQTEVDDGA